MTQLLPAQQKVQTVRVLLERSKAQIAQALPKGYLTADRLTRIAMTSVQRTPKLLDCDPISLVGAVIQSAQLGLEPDGVLGQAYLIPYGRVVQFQPGYKGLLALARRSGDISGVEARIVHAKDHFRYAFGLKPDLEHVPAATEDRGEPTYVYAVVRLKDGTAQWDVMSANEIEAHRKKYSRAAQDGPWVTAWEEMAKKTVLKRVLKLAPASVELQTAIALDEHAEAGLNQGLDAVATAVEIAETKAATKLEALTEKLGVETSPVAEAPSAPGSVEAEAAAPLAPPVTESAQELFDGPADQVTRQGLINAIDAELVKWATPTMTEARRVQLFATMSQGDGDLTKLDEAMLSDMLGIFRAYTAKTPAAVKQVRAALGLR